MAHTATRIQVDIAGKRYVGRAPFTHWRQSPRQAASDRGTHFLEVASASHVPFENPSVEWNFIHMSADGFGVAVNQEKSQQDQIDGGCFFANVFITTDHGRHWERNPMRLSWRSRLRSGFSWPVEQYQSLVVTEHRTILLAWEDPWIMERSRSHVVLSDNCGRKWRYRCLKQCSPCLYTAPKGQIMCFSSTMRYYSGDEGKHWRADTIRLDLNNDHVDADHSDIRNATFISEQQGFALLVKHRKTASPPVPETVILLKTDTHGLTWQGIAAFPFPSGPVPGDPQRMLGLNVT
jgi:hypothetical protein